MRPLTSRTALRRLRLFLLLQIFLHAPAVAVAEHESINAPTRVTSDKMTSRNNPKVHTFSGNARAVQEGIVVESDELIVLYKKTGGISSIKGVGRVKITSKTGVTTGDKAELFPSKQKVVVAGNAVSKMEEGDIMARRIESFYGKKGEALKKVIANGGVRLIIGTTTVTGSHAVHLPLEDKSVVTGNALALLEDGEIESDKLTLHYYDGEEGRQMEELVADGNVVMTSDNGVVTGDHAEHFVSRKVTDVSGNAVAIDKETKVEAEEIKVFHAKEKSEIKKAYAYRNVKITGEFRKITGNRAVLYPKNKKVIVTGNAIYRKEGEDIKGKKITYFYERDDIIISGGSKNRAKVRIAPMNKQKPVKKQVKEDGAVD